MKIITIIVCIAIGLLIWRFFWSVLARLLGIALVIIIGFGIIHWWNDNSNHVSQHTTPVTSSQVVSSQESSYSSQPNQQSINASLHNVWDNLQATVHNYEQTQDQTQFKQQVNQIGQQVNQIPLLNQGTKLLVQGIQHMITSLEQTTTPQQAQQILVNNQQKQESQWNQTMSNAPITSSSRQ